MTRLLFLPAVHCFLLVLVTALGSLFLEAESFVPHHSSRPAATTNSGTAFLAIRSSHQAGQSFSTGTTRLFSSYEMSRPESDPKHVETILFVECGFGADAHGQDSTKAAVRACRNAIEFNQIPSISNIVPGGYDNMKLDVLLAVPEMYQPGLDLDAVRNCFPYGQVKIQIQNGGMVANSGKVIESMGDKNDDMVVVCVAVTVGY